MQYQQLLNDSRMLDQDFSLLSQNRGKSLVERLDRTKLQIGVPQLQEEQDLRDLFQVLNDRSPSEAFRADQMKIDQLIQQASRDTSKYLTVGEVQKKEKMQDLLVERRKLLQQEKSLRDEVKHLQEVYNVNRRIQLQRGFYNRDFENQKRDMTHKLLMLRERLKKDVSKWQNQLEDVSNGNFFNKKPVQKFLSLNPSNSMDLKFLRDKISRDELSLLSKKQQVMMDSIERPDEEINDNGSFVDQVKFLYKGATLTGSKEEQVGRLTQLRNQLERHQNGGFLRDSSEPLVNLKVEAESPRQKTLKEIESLRKDYLKAGGNDPIYLKNLNNLESNLNRSLPALPKSRYQQSRQRPYIKSFGTQQNHTLQNASRMILNDSSSLNPSQMDNSSINIQNHPIYQFLPKSFKNELDQVVKQSYNLMNNPALAMLNVKKPELKSSKGGPEPESEETMLEYLRVQEAEILLQMSRISESDPTYPLYAKKFADLQNMKGVIEQALIQRKIRNMSEIQNDLNNKRTAQILKANPLFEAQYSQGKVSVAYSPLEGFAIRWDFVTNLTLSYKKVRINYGVFRKGDDFYTYRNTEDHLTTFETYRSNKALLIDKDILRDVEPLADSIIYVELWGFIEDFQGGTIPETVGWTGNYGIDISYSSVGRFKLPFYSKQLSPNKLLAEQSLPYVGNQSLYLRITLPQDPILDSDSQVFIENEYVVPELHLHKTGDIIKIDQYQPQPQQKTTVLPDTFNDSRIVKGQITPNEMAITGLRSSKVEEKQPIQQFNQPPPMSQETVKPRPQLIRRNVDKKSTILSITKDTEGGASVKNNDLPTGKSQVNKISRFGFANRAGGGSASNINKSTPQSGDKIPTDAHVVETIVIKVTEIKYFDEPLDDLKIKIGLFAGRQLLKDTNKNPCILFTQLKTTSSNASGTQFDFYTEMTIDLSLAEQLFTESELQDSYIFFAFYQHGGRDLLAWNVQQILTRNQFSQQLELRTGKFRDNLIEPPGQSPPFDESKMQKSNLMVEYILSRVNEGVAGLTEYKTYIPVKIQKKEKPVELKSIKNIDWNTQITFQIIKIFNFPNKNELSVRVAMLYEKDLVLDVYDRPCLTQSDLDAFETDSRSVYQTHFVTTFRLGYQYLIDNYGVEPKGLTYFLSFFMQGQVIGIVQYPVMKQKKSEIESGLKSIPLYQVNPQTGQQGSKTKMSVEIVIRETHLQMDDIERQPGLVKKPTGHYRIDSDVDQSGTNQREQEGMMMTVIVDKVTNIRTKGGFILKMCLVKGKEFLKDRDQRACAVTSEVFENKSNTIDFDMLSFQFNIKIGLYKQEDDVKLLIYLNKEDNTACLWVVYDVFERGIIPTGSRSKRMFLPPYQKPPFDSSKFKASTSDIILKINI